MSDSDTAFRKYVTTINEALRGGPTTELSHRRALQDLLHALGKGISTTDEPGRVRDAFPDILVRKGEAILGYIETKDIGKDLSKWPRDKQGMKYLSTYDNLILTDYMDFVWFVDGEQRGKKQTLGHVKDNGISTTEQGREFVTQLLYDFLTHKPEPIGKTDELAKRMAAKAHGIGELLVKELDDKGSTSPLFAQVEAFRKTLVRNLSDSEFADMYAQTLAYGLFAAREQHHTKHLSKPFTLTEATNFIPKANPFLRQLFRIGSVELSDMDSVAWLIEDLVQLLKQCDIAEIMRDFGKKMVRQDPVVDLYETFLKHYDPETREMRGVYFTPEPVVSYIVRSIDELLITEFDKELGLADPEVMILDPAAGTGTFLYHAIKLIHKRIVETHGKAAWQSYAREKLIPRIFGFELLMAPYTICHLKLALLLEELGYSLTDNERLHIYLTNALEPGVPQLKKKDPVTTFAFAEEIVKESRQAAEVKYEKPIWVVIGNPPYSGISANKGTWIVGLLKGKVADGVPICSYYDVDGHPLGEKKVWLQDDYVKFLRFAQWRIEKTGHGIVGMITNHAWLDNPTFRGMRQKMLKAFDKVFLLDLHGNKKKKERAPEGGPDENVFDIQQGVAISLFVKRQKSNATEVKHADLWGLAGKDKSPPDQGTKYAYLEEFAVQSTKWEELHPKSPYYFCIPRDEMYTDEYASYWSVQDIMPVHVTGIVTACDSVVIDFEDKPILRRIDFLKDKSITDNEAKASLNLSKIYSDRIEKTREKIREVENAPQLFKDVLYRPFDSRRIFFHPSLVWRTRDDVMRHMLTEHNLALVTVRQVAEGDFDHVFVSETIVDNRFTHSNKGIAYALPLYLYYEKDKRLDKRESNLKSSFISEFEGKLKVMKKSLEPRTVFNYIYAVLHSPTYRKRYAEFLKISFPRIPLTSSEKLFRKLAELGGELVDLHLLRHEMLNDPIAKYQGMGDDVVRKVRWHDVSGRVYINDTQYFEGVESKHWNFYIGGYQVLHKWLKDREKVNRKLTYDEIETYCKIITVIDETMRLMAKIDHAIPSWPMS